MKNSHIEWTDHTFNPWEGCTKVSPGCAHCYAETRNARWNGGTAPNWGPGAPRRRTSASNWRGPVVWNQMAKAFKKIYDDGRGCWRMEDAELVRALVKLRRPRVFCASLADWLDDEVPIEWLAELLALIKATPFLDWQLLTKRPQNWRGRMLGVCRMRISEGPAGIEQASGAAFASAWLNGAPPANVWIGTTVENQRYADERVPQLLEIPGFVRFLSCEPLLNTVKIYRYLSTVGVRKKASKIERFKVDGIDWIICGGESGRQARPMHPAWARDLRDQCAELSVPFFFKQWGEWAPGECVDVKGTLNCATFLGEYWEYSKQTENQSQHCHADDAPDMFRVGKKSAGRLLDGVEHNDFPQPSTPVSHLCGHAAA